MTAPHNPRLLQSRDEGRELAQFIQRCHGGVAQAGVYHIGDVWWYLALHDEPRIAIWEDEAGQIEGFVWLEGPNAPLMHIRPDLRGTGRLEGPMLAWAAQAWPAEAAWTRVYESDTATTRWLLANGWSEDSFAMVVHRRDMAQPIAPPVVPDGFALRHVAESELEERVEAHRDAFHPSKLTLEKYLRARVAPDYDPELDIVAVAPDGTIAAYCIAWYDPANRIGYFEPVGTRAAFRGQRLGQGVLNEALHRLLARGARETIVATEEHNAPARRLYESVGCLVVGTERQYVKRHTP